MLAEEVSFSLLWVQKFFGGSLQDSDNGMNSAA